MAFVRASALFHLNPLQDVFTAWLPSWLCRPLVGLESFSDFGVHILLMFLQAKEMVIMLLLQVEQWLGDMHFFFFFCSSWATAEHPACRTHQTQQVLETGFFLLAHIAFSLAKSLWTLISPHCQCRYYMASSNIFHICPFCFRTGFSLCIYNIQ